MKQFKNLLGGEVEDALHLWDTDPYRCEGMTTASNGPITKEEKLMDNINFITRFYYGE